jgi:hypothetical protein
MACGYSSIRLQVIYFKKENYVDLYWRLYCRVGLPLHLKEAKASDSPMRSKLPTWRASMRRQGHSNLGLFCNWNASCKAQCLVSILPTSKIRTLMARERLKILGT